jgi:hypothetical protein
MPTDTPLKASFGISSIRPTMADHEREKVQNELNDFYYAVDTDDFLKEFLNVDKKLVESVLDELETRNCDSRYNKRWTLFPDKNLTRESQLYGPFVQTANGIIETAESLRSGFKRNDVAGRWVACPNERPESTDKLAAAVRPDVAFVSTQTSSSALEYTNNELADLDKKLNGKRSVQVEDAKIEEVGVSSQFKLHDVLIYYITLV